MELPEMKMQLESIDRCLEHHDNGKPYTGPPGMQTDGYKQWLAERDGFRSTRDKLMREIDAQEKLLANKPFAPVPPTRDEAAAAPVEEGPADHLAGTDKHKLGITQAEYLTGTGGELGQYLECQREWSAKTFGPGLRTVGNTRHISLELEEIRKSPEDPDEWLDVVILALDGYWRCGGSIPEVMLEMQRIQDRNLGRTYPMPESQDRPSEHIRDDDKPPAPVEDGPHELESEIRRLLDVLDQAGIRVSALGAEAKFYKPDGSYEWLPLEEWTRRRKEWAKKV